MEILSSDPEIQTFLSYYSRTQVVSVLLCLIKSSIARLKPSHPPLSELETWANSESNKMDESLKKDLLKIRATLHKLDKKLTHTLKDHNILPESENKEFQRTRALSAAGVNVNHRNYNVPVDQTNIPKRHLENRTRDVQRMGCTEKAFDYLEANRHNALLKPSQTGVYKKTEAFGMSNNDRVYSNPNKGAADIAVEFLNNSVISKFEEENKKLNGTRITMPPNYRVLSQPESHVKRREDFDNPKWDMTGSKRLKNSYGKQFGEIGENVNVKGRLDLDDWKEIRHQYI